MSDRSAARLSVGIFAMLVGFIAFLSIVYFYPFEPIVFHRAILVEDRVKAGSAIEIVSCFDKFTDKPGMMTRYLVAANDGGQIITLTGPLLATAKAGDSFKVVRIEIPDYIVSGKYYIRWVVGYDYFGLRTVYVTSETPIFSVEKQ